jgi:hypothetical protein
MDCTSAVRRRPATPPFGGELHGRGARAHLHGESPRPDGVGAQAPAGWKSTNNIMDQWQRPDDTRTAGAINFQKLIENDRKGGMPLRAGPQPEPYPSSAYSYRSANSPRLRK